VLQVSVPASPERSPRAGIRAVLARPGVRSAFTLNLLARLPLAALGVLLLLRIGEEHGYAAAGAIDAILAVAMAIAGAAWARATQHVGMSRVLLPLAALNGCAVVAAGVLPANASIWAFAAVAVAIGITEPPLPGTMRALWDRLLPTPEERHVGYALDGSAGEAVFTLAPALLVGGIAATFSPSTALIVGGCASAAAGVAFALVPAVRSAPAAEERDRSRGLVGVLRYPGVRTAAAISVAMGLHIGPVEVGLTAFGQQYGTSGTVGMLFALWAVGGMVAGLAMTRLSPPTDPARRMALILIWMGGWAATFAAAGSIAVAVVPLLLSGMAITPVFITLNGTFDRIAPPGVEAEIYNITLAGVLIGIVLGSPLAGFTVDAVGPAAGLAVSAAGPLLGAALAVARRRDFAPTS
jgi:Major Facilitator Superfamily